MKRLISQNNDFSSEEFMGDIFVLLLRYKSNPLVEPVPADMRPMRSEVMTLSESVLTDPVIMSYIRAPRLHQSTALLWPDRVRISGALIKHTHKWASRTQTLSVKHSVAVCACMCVSPTCTRWCRRRCVWRFHHEWIPYRGQSRSAWCVLQKGRRKTDDPCWRADTI